jgi:hypothetical protein
MNWNSKLESGAFSEAAQAYKLQNAMRKRTCQQTLIRDWLLKGSR